MTPESRQDIQRKRINDVHFHPWKDLVNQAESPKVYGSLVQKQVELAPPILQGTCTENPENVKKTNKHKQTDIWLCQIYSFFRCTKNWTLAARYLHSDGDAFSIVVQRQMLFKLRHFLLVTKERFLIDAVTSDERDSFFSPQLAIRSSRKCRGEIPDGRSTFPNLFKLSFTWSRLVSYFFVDCCLILLQQWIFFKLGGENGIMEEQNKNHKFYLAAVSMVARKNR